MLNREIIQRVQSAYSRGVQSDDTRLSSRHIYNKLITLRSQLLTETKNKKQFLSQWNFQKLSCIEMVKKPAHACPCIPPLGCYMLRSKFELPEPLTSNTRHLIQYVANLSGDVMFDATQFHMVKYRSGNKYTSQRNEYFFENKYLWVITKKNEAGIEDKFRVISMSAVFEHPDEVEAFVDFCKANPCRNCPPPEEEDCTSMLDKNFPLDNDLLDKLVTMALDELLLIPAKVQAREDATTDTRDNIAQESK